VFVSDRVARVEQGATEIRRISRNFRIRRSGIFRAAIGASVWLRENLCGRNQSAQTCHIKKLGAIPIDANGGDPVAEIKQATSGKGVDVSLELIGSAKTMRQAVQCLAPLGRAALVGLTNESMAIFPYEELLNREAEIIGVSDHLASELPALIEFARNGKLCFPPESLRVVDLEAGQINTALDALQDSIDHVRTVIKVTCDT